MILINHTLSFAPEIEQDGVHWIQTTFKPLLESCPLVAEILFCRLTSDPEVTDTYIIQIRFASSTQYTNFNTQYEQDFMQALHLRFQNNFGIFTSKLEHL